jgi:uncharacterized membrane protein YjjP (DUF1212 family)
MVLFLAPVLNIVLIFLIFILFYFPSLYLFFLIFLSAIVFDTLSGLFWGTNLIILLVSLGSGILLTRFLEKSHFFPRLIIGESIIFIYYLCFFITNLVLKTPYISFIIFEQFIIISIFYVALSFLFDKIENQKVEILRKNSRYKNNYCAYVIIS